MKALALCVLSLLCSCQSLDEYLVRHGKIDLEKCQQLLELQEKESELKIRIDVINHDLELLEKTQKQIKQAIKEHNDQAVKGD